MSVSLFSVRRKRDLPLKRPIHVAAAGRRTIFEYPNENDWRDYRYILHLVSVPCNRLSVALNRSLLKAHRSAGKIKSEILFRRESHA